MNGLALRINRGGGGKSKNSIGYSPIAIPDSLLKVVISTEIEAFINSPSTDDQLAILKNIMDANKDSFDDNVMKFMVAAFFHADAKHPIKCFISRHISKNQNLHEPFSQALGNHICSIPWNSGKPPNYKQYVDIVNKLLTCIENLQAGKIAICKNLHDAIISCVADLFHCLECCVTTLREQKNLSPTEKNEIFTLAHTSLRLILYSIQRATDMDFGMLIFYFGPIMELMQDLMFDDDVPMDTKSVCGILFLSLHVAEHKSCKWIELLNESTTDSYLSKLLRLEAGRLSLFSAMVTVAPVDQLFTQTVYDSPLVVTLTNKILEIGERSSSESALILGVARTLLQISKLLDKLADSATGLTLVEALLMFAWGHLEHYMDSVRHLAGQTLGCVVKYCAKTNRDGDSAALDALTAALAALERSRKSLYVCVSWLAAELSAQRLLAVVRPADVIHALAQQPLRNTAGAALDALLPRLCAECSLAQLRGWLLAPLLRAAAGADSATLAALERALTRATAHRPDLMRVILSYTKAAEPGAVRDQKCILLLLRVARKSCVTDTTSQAGEADSEEWRGVISYDILKEAAIDAVDETRILSLSLVVESQKSTEQFTPSELSFVLHFLHYNINAQAPSFRQLTMSYMKKFIKRLEESYNVIKRERQPNGVSDKVAYYLNFAEELRRQCFDSLIPGANYSRRFVALQILAWCEQITLEGYDRGWEPEYVEKLLLHLEDSYENNKGLALQVLASCPDHLLTSKNYSISLDIEDIFRQASSLKPTECVSAGYKLDLLRTRLPDYILQDEPCAGRACPVQYVLVSRLLALCRAQLCVLARSVLQAAAQAPVYGALHCLARQLLHVHAREISSDEQWTALIGEIIDTCMEVNDAVACVVNNSSPEGHLPMDMTVQITDHGNTGNVTLNDGRQVTSQMVLLCAWRCVKEVSLLLGGMCARLSVRPGGEGQGEGEGGGGSLSAAQLERVGSHFTALLAETKHRGAFEQAYVGFTLLLDRLWRSRSAALHGLPRVWLAHMLRGMAGDAALCATRRSAGVPFIIQALVTTEIQVQGNPLCFNGCMSSLLGLAAGGSVHALHVLRALVRHAGLAERVAPHVGRALLVALQAFDAHSWAERNSSTLLLSALVQRVFGVQRSTMTGRIFFLRYPEVYDFMLEKLQEVSMDADSHVVRPSLYPVLLLLARLYPSSLEGTVSNLKLVAFIPSVCVCARSRVLHVRQLAARALVPLIAPDRYIAHLQSMFELLHDSSIPRNYCHGILLQLVRLLHVEGASAELAQLWPGWATPAMWLLGQAGGAGPCYLIADEFVKLLNLLLMRSPTVPQETVTEICSHLHTLIFEARAPTVSLGRDICLSNAMYLYLILATQYNPATTTHLVYKGLEHSSYEVVLSVLNYLLILHNDLKEKPCKFHEHIKSISKTTSLSEIKNENYIQLLCNVLKSNYLECQEKSLKILVLEGNTQRNIIETKMGVKVTDDMVVDKLLDFIQNEHEKVTHVYLQSLLNFVTGQLQDSSVSVRVLLDVIRVVFECSSSDNSEDTRKVVVGFIETNIRQLLGLELEKVHELSRSEKFELLATIWATIITLVEDDEDAIRQRVSDVLSPTRVTPSRGCDIILTFLRNPKKREESADLLGSRSLETRFPDLETRFPDLERVYIENWFRNGLFAIIALLDFQSVVVVADDVSEECRVFDQNERYNIHLEETVWTSTCAEILANDFRMNERRVAVMTTHSALKETFDKLCKDNVEVFREMAFGNKLQRSEALNPKIELFVNKLRSLTRDKPFPIGPFKQLVVGQAHYVV